MLTYYLMAYICTTAAQDDCQARFLSAYFEEDAGLRCEMDRARMLERHPWRGNRLISLDCEPSVETVPDER